MGCKRGQQVWWKAVVELLEPACIDRLIHKKHLLHPHTRCLVLCLDIVVEDSNHLDEDDKFEEVVHAVESPDK